MADSSERSQITRRRRPSVPRHSPSLDPSPLEAQSFQAPLAAGAYSGSGSGSGAGDSDDARVSIADIEADEDLFAHIRRVRGGFDHRLYQRIVGAANEHKEGDEAIGVAAADPASRARARTLLARACVRDLLAHPLFEDELHTFINASLDRTAMARTRDWTLGRLRDFLLAAGEDEIKAIAPGLSSDVIGCVVKLMSDEELIAVGRKVFNPLPGSKLGARGYLGARIQPNSPIDHVDDIRWQVFDGWSYAVGDVVLGTNPVSSEPASVAAVEQALAEILDTFGLAGVMPHCVLAHIDVQAEVEARWPGSTALWFQSLGGTAAANRTFDLTIDKMVAHARSRTGPYALYFETGQGADATNGHAAGFDMVVHEARKYGFARALAREVALARRPAAEADTDTDAVAVTDADADAVRSAAAPWVHVNDVAGFIGPEVFRTRAQLVRCCLEDIVMGKLHGLMIGLDVCSTLHMDVSLDDLDWCLERIMPANPGYLMALPTRNDPMLSYLTTAFQDHVRLRERFGYRVNDAMWAFFQDLGVIDAQGRPGPCFGRPARVYLQYRRRKGDTRPEAEILDEAAAQMAAVRARGVPLAEGHGDAPWDLAPSLDRDMRRLYADAKASLWSELAPGFVDTIPDALRLRTRSKDRKDYILHPLAGEQLDDASARALADLRARREQAAAAAAAGGPGAADGQPDVQPDVQIVISDGLNARAIMDDGHLLPYLDALRRHLAERGYRVAREHLVLFSGRVRAGYRIGEVLFGSSGPGTSGSGQPGATGARVLVHVIGERPGTGHHNFSVYLTAPPAALWARPGAVDHDITRVISGISDTALTPARAAEDTARILDTLTVRGNGPAARGESLAAPGGDATARGA